MSGDYDWDVSRQATERIIQLTKKERVKFFDFFDQIVTTGNQEYDEEFYDQYGQKHFIKVFGKRIITYSIDDPISLVHIEAIE
jgi:hypothetical protein